MQEFILKKKRNIRNNYIYNRFNKLLPNKTALATAFNMDVKPDFVITNDDNGEYSSPPKYYYGIRIYLNKGDTKFEKSLCITLIGAFRALARDYDKNGGTDIAAISYFPNYKNFI
jgi:hypothetical protein